MLLILYIVLQVSVLSVHRSTSILMCVNIYRPFTGPLPPALDPPKDKAITVHFNAILPKAAWEWDDSTSEIYIRFMDVELGHRSYDLGPGKIKW